MSEDEDVVRAARRYRPRRAEPWHIGSVVPWGIVATVGDPALLVAPLAGAVLGIFAMLAIGVPARPETIVPVWSLPPFGAYQDAGAVDLAAAAVPMVWLGRTAFLVARAAIFGAAAHLAQQRARDETPRLVPAVAAVRARLGTLCLIELVGWAIFAIPLVLGQGSILAEGRPVSQLGLLVGQVLLVNAYFAALDGATGWGALRAGLAWTATRPLGHVATVLVATAASNGVVWVASAGEVGSPRWLTLALYAAVHALVAGAFTCVFARRHRLLYAAPAEGAAGV